MLLRVTRIGAIRLATYDFLLAIRSNQVSVLLCLYLEPLLYYDD